MPGERRSLADHAAPGSRSASDAARARSRSHIAADRVAKGNAPRSGSVDHAAACRGAQGTFVWASPDSRTAANASTISGRDRAGASGRSEGSTSDRNAAASVACRPAHASAQDVEAGRHDARGRPVSTHRFARPGGNSAAKYCGPAFRPGCAAQGSQHIRRPDRGVQ